MASLIKGTCSHIKRSWTVMRYMYIYELSFSETIMTILLDVIIRTVQPHPSLDLVHRNVLFQVFQIITVADSIKWVIATLYDVPVKVHNTRIDINGPIDPATKIKYINRKIYKKKKYTHPIVHNPIWITVLLIHNHYKW